MKRILAPTDFSPASQVVLPYLKAFHQRLQSEITFLHTYEARSTSSMLVSIDSILREDADRRLANWKAAFTKDLDSEAGVHTKAVKGNMVDVLKEMLEKESFDLAAFGTTGVSGFLEMMEGSFTNKVLKNTTVPLLAIPENYTYKPFSTIVLAVDDLVFDSPDLLQPLKTVVEAWNSTLWVYHKDTGDQSAPSIEALNDLPSVRYFHEPEDKESILQSILAFCADQDASLLCMIRHKQSFMERAFNMSMTSQSLFSAMLPMLFLSE